MSLLASLTGEIILSAGPYDRLLFHEGAMHTFLSSLNERIF